MKTSYAYYGESPVLTSSIVDQFCDGACSNRRLLVVMEEGSSLDDGVLQSGLEDSLSGNGYEIFDWHTLTGAGSVGSIAKQITGTDALARAKLGAKALSNILLTVKLSGSGRDVRGQAVGYTMRGVIRAIRADNGRVLLSMQEQAYEVGIDNETAKRNALESLSTTLAEALVEKLGAAIGQTQLTIEVPDPQSLVDGVKSIPGVIDAEAVNGKLRLQINDKPLPILEQIEELADLQLQKLGG